MKEKLFFAHETAVTDEGCMIGVGTKIWHFSHIMADCVLGERCNIGQNVVISPKVVLGNNVKVQENVVHIHEKDRAAGYLEFENARVRWFLSINSEYLPKEIKEKGQTTFRSITIDGKELEFSGGFTDLHTMVYKDILEGKGYGLDATRTAIEIVHDIRNTSPVELKGEYHSFLK